MAVADRCSIRVEVMLSYCGSCLICVTTVYETLITSVGLISCTNLIVFHYGHIGML